MNIAFLIWSIVALFFLILGIYVRFSTKPASFWANMEAPKVKDIKELEDENLEEISIRIIEEKLNKLKGIVDELEKSNVEITKEIAIECIQKKKAQLNSAGNNGE